MQETCITNKLLRRQVRIPDRLWREAKKRAVVDGLHTWEVVVRALRCYLSDIKGEK